MRREARFFIQCGVIFLVGSWGKLEWITLGIERVKTSKWLDTCSEARHTDQEERKTVLHAMKILLMPLITIFALTKD